MIRKIHECENRESLARALAGAVAEDLAKIISERGAATLAVSGGTTPALFFDRLSREDMAWDKVTVTLVDERQVGEESPRSNARLVREQLLQNNAASARFVPLYENSAAASGLSLDVVVLGMGNDGHTASFFPGGDTLAEAVAPHTEQSLIAITAPAAGEPRLTYTLPKLLAAGRIYLHIEGAEKRQVLARAQSGGDVMEMPIRAVLLAPQPLTVFWCP